MNLAFKTTLTVSVLTFGMSALASDDHHQLTERLQDLTGLHVLAAEPAPIENFIQLVTPTGIFYVSEDGIHIFSGALHKFENGFPSLTEERLSVVRKASIDEWADTFITYESPIEQHEIVVFYDTSCGFCVRMHQNIETYLQQGITIHYAAFPRGGATSPSANDLKNIFCADDKHAAMDASVNSQPAPEAICQIEGLIASHYQLGDQLGIRGTPAIYTLENAMAIEGGAIPAPQLKGLLDAL